MVVAGEEAAASGEFVEDDAEGEDIGAGVDGFAAALFGGHVGVFASEGARVGVFFLLEAAHLRNTEIKHFGLAVEGDEDVLGADVAVDDVEGVAVVVGEGVNVIETFAGVDDEFDGEVLGDGVVGVFGAVHEFGDGGAGHMFHDEEVGAVEDIDVVGVDDVGVGEAACDVGLVVK